MAPFVFNILVIYFLLSMTLKILTKLGLSEKEAKIYKAALESGPETVQKIARKAEITRTSAYLHLKSLMKKGLINNNVRDKKTYFYAEPPENLLTLVDLRKKETLELSSELQKLLPQLRSLFETNEERPRVHFFEGKTGLEDMINDFMKAKFASAEEFVPLDEAYAFSPPRKGDHRQKIDRKFRKIPRRIIYTSKSEPVLETKKGLRERRFLPKEKFPFAGSVTIYGNKVALINHKTTVSGVIIENKEIAETLRTMFNLAWETTEKYQK